MRDCGNIKFLQGDLQSKYQDIIVITGITSILISPESELLWSH